MIYSQIKKFMKYLRIIPKLDIKGDNLVKGIHLEGLRVLGKPSEFIKYYEENGADEIIYNDVVASLYGRNGLLDLISFTAKECSIPITVAGGIRSIDDIKNVLKAGADKVAINTAAINDINFISSAVNIFGSSTIVITIESSYYNDKFMVFTNNGRESTGLSVLEWTQIVQERGAGEILLTSIDNDGTGKGFNESLIELVKDKIKIPLIVHGGAKTPEDIMFISKRFKINSFSISSMVHYNLIKNKDNETQNFILGNTSFLQSKKMFKQFGEYSIKSIKDELSKNNINTRNIW